MSLGEFSLIEKYFSALGASRADVLLGVGDDAAQVAVSLPQTLVMAIDTMVEGVHFPVNTSPSDVGYKLLAVNLSDMAAMGAAPCWFTLALTLPHSDEAWLSSFASGMTELAIEHDIQLIGGDTTKGPMVLSLQAHGLVMPERCLTRSGAKLGDDIYVTGTLGDAALGLKVALGDCKYPESTYLLSRLNRPTPRVELGKAISSWANSAIDISDGLLADLGHICRKSGVGAQIQLESLPLSSAYLRADVGYNMALCGGDDYELCFTASVQYRETILSLSEQYDCPVSCIGKVTSGDAIECIHFGERYQVSRQGYQHFAEP